MRPPRLFTLIIGFGVILGLMLWLVNSLYWLYIQISFATPLLANLLLLLLIALLGALIAGFLYYVYLFRSGRTRRSGGNSPAPRVPLEKVDAAEENLKAVRRQLAQIEDEVTRKALLERSHDIEDEFYREELRVVVFGTGSAGKTSLVNALMGRMVGEVGAPMGTTEIGETYALEMPGLDWQLVITDTPGILEAGVMGTHREQLARQLATEADLLLFVLDNDLRQSEYDPLTTLAKIGKRSLVVLNKIDRFPEEDLEAILARLRQRVRGFFAPQDVVAITADPQPMILENGQTIKPDPDIMPLIRRLAAILRAEGEDLIADNILLQSQRLSDEARRLIDIQRRRQAEKIVERFQWIGAGVIWVTPVPVVDLLATAAINAQMVVEIGKVYGCELNADRGRELAISLAKTLASLGIVKGVIELVSAALKLSVGGFVVGQAIQSVSAAYLTRIAGKSFIEYFRHDQDWGDGGITEVVQRQFQLNRRDEFVKAFIQEAIAKLPESFSRVVMQPLNIPERHPAREQEEEYERENW
jgi:uncharacterized protein